MLATPCVGQLHSVLLRTLPVMYYLSPHFTDYKTEAEMYSHWPKSHAVTEPGF